MKYSIKWTSRFKKDIATAKKRGYDIGLLQDAVQELASGHALDSRYRDHALTGSFHGCRECHIAPDWLLVYVVMEDILVLTLTRTGTHSDLFE